MEFDTVTDTFARNIPTYRLTALRKQDPRNIQYERRTKGNIRNHGMNFYFQSIKNNGYLADVEIIIL